MARTERSSHPVGTARTVIAIATVAGAVSALARYRLRNFAYPLDWSAALDGAAETFSATAPAAIKTVVLLVVLAGACASWLRRRAPSLTGGEALAAATVGLWTGAYVTALSLGPTGLYTSWMLRALVAVLVIAALMTRGHRRPREDTPLGAWLAVGAFALALAPLLLLQLASPVSPFMDVLPYVASVQKIVTFEFYDPFANDAAGHWAPTRQLAGVNSIFSLVALVTGSTADLAMTSLIVPLAAFQILGVYLLGRTIGGPAAGGMAALFLLETFVWRRVPDTRGTVLAFPLVAIGLTFLFEKARADGTLRIALGGLALGLAVVVNPLIGALGMQTAAVCTIIVWADLGREFWRRVLALGAGSVLALPQVAVGLAFRLPWWAMSGIALVALLTLALLARGSAPDSERRTLALARSGLTLAVMLTIVFLHARQMSEFFPQNWLGYASLALLAGGGLAVCASLPWGAPLRYPAAAIPAIALGLALVNHGIADPLRFQGTVEMKSLASEVTTKMTAYWWPYWLAIASGVLFGVLGRQWRLPVTAVALTFVIYPFQQPAKALDFDTAQLSLAETWGFNLTNAARGYHAGRADRRWVTDENWDKVRTLMLEEMRSGRVDYYTRVLNVSPSISSVELALNTGISVDLVTPQYDPLSIWSVGSRVQHLDALPEALAKRPRYVLIQYFPQLPHPIPPEYERILVVPRAGLLLYRLRPPD